MTAVSCSLKIIIDKYNDNVSILLFNAIICEDDVKFPWWLQDCSWKSRLRSLSVELKQYWSCHQDCIELPWPVVAPVNWNSGRTQGRISEFCKIFFNYRITITAKCFFQGLEGSCHQGLQQCHRAEARLHQGTAATWTSLWGQRPTSRGHEGLRKGSRNWPGFERSTRCLHGESCLSPHLCSL